MYFAKKKKRHHATKPTESLQICGPGTFATIRGRNIKSICKGGTAREKGINRYHYRGIDTLDYVQRVYARVLQTHHTSIMPE